MSDREMSLAWILRVFSGRARKGRHGGLANGRECILGDGGRWKVTWPRAEGMGGGRRWQSRDFYSVVRKCRQFRRNSRAIRTSANGCPACRVWPIPSLALMSSFCNSLVTPFVLSSPCLCFSRLLRVSCPSIEVTFGKLVYLMHKIYRTSQNCHNSFHLC